MGNLISKYVYQFVSSRKEHLIYCSRTNAILKLSEGLSQHIEECKEEPLLLEELEDELLELFKKHKIVVSAEEDQDFLLERRFLEDQITFSTATVGLVLVPTLGCNFSCPYCFEEGKTTGSMSDRTIGELIAFIHRHELAKKLEITWYGGEPLLAFEKIKKILDRIKKEVPLPIAFHSIITNGYYFTDEVIEFFREHPLDNIQITLDGDKSRHDTIRRQRGSGEGSYERLIRNMDNILEKLPDVQLSVRINVDRDNAESFTELHRELSERWKNKKVKIYPGILRIDNKDKTALACPGMGHWEAFDLYYKLRKQKMAEGSVVPELQYHKGCCATVCNAYIIGPEGEIYKCWNDVSNKNKIIGYICNSKFTNPSLFYRYIIGSKSSGDPECLACSLLPVCSGNCAFYRLRNLYEKGEYTLCQCLQKSPNLLNKCLEELYMQNKS